MTRQGRTADKKDILLELLARDVKELQRAFSQDRGEGGGGGGGGGGGSKVFSDGDEAVELLCDHLDHVLMHGLINFEDGYWSFVSYFTRRDLIQQINRLKRVTTNIGKGRSWLYSALNEQSLESYVRMFSENLEIAEKFYLRDAFVRDDEYLLILLTLVSGLDFISFDLHLDCDYLDYGASRSSSQITSHPILKVTPRFLSSKVDETGSGRQRAISDPTHKPPPPPSSEDMLTRGGGSRRRRGGGGRRDKDISSSSSHEPNSISTNKSSESQKGMMSSSLQMTSSRNILERMSSAVEMRPSQFPTTTHQGVWSGAEKKEEEEEDVLVAKERRSGRSKRRRRKKNDISESSGPSHVTVPGAPLFETNDPVPGGAPQLMGMEECDYETELKLRVMEEKVEEKEKRGGGGGGGGEVMNLEMELALAVRDEQVDDDGDGGDDGDGEEGNTLPSPSPSGPSTVRNDQRGGLDGETPELGGDYDIITQGEVRSLEGRRERCDAMTTTTMEEEEEDERREEMERTRRKGGRRRVDSGPPERPTEMSEEEKMANDIRIDETMKVVFTIDVFLPVTDRQTPPTPPPPPSDPARQRRSSSVEEEARRLVQVKTPSGGLGQYRTGYILITTEAIYLLRRDGIEGIFSREFGARFKDIDHLVIGLGWQSIGIVYRDRMKEEEKEEEEEEESELQNCIIVTGSEAVSRSVMSTIQTMATQCRGFKRVIPKNRDSEVHVEAIEKELIKLGSGTNMDVIGCSMVSWEQIEGTINTASHTSSSSSSEMVMNGPLYYKKSSRVGLSSWKQGYFRLMNGVLHQYNSENDKVSRMSYTLTQCGGCTRLSSSSSSSMGESKQFVLSLSLSSGQPLLLATPTENELTRWQQTLCEAVVTEPVSEKSRYPICTVLLTKEKVHILQEDLSRGIVHHLTCCDVTAVEKVCVNFDLRFYCTLTYDDGEDNKGVWLLCFTSEYELGKFERSLSQLWKEEFQIDLPFSEVDDAAVIARAQHAIDLLHSTGNRSDSITRGRTEFTYNSIF